METEAPAALAIIIGTRNGDTRRSPFSSRSWICSSSVVRPPTPVAIMTPLRPGSAGGSPPASSSAMPAAAMANWVKRSARRASFGLSYQGLGSKSVTGRVGPTSVTGRSSPSQKASLPRPHAATTPMPVTATRRLFASMGCLLELGGDQVVGLADGGDALEIFLGHGDPKLFFERHH